MKVCELRERANRFINLSDTQLGVLITIAASASPEVAHMATTGAENAVSAREALIVQGLVTEVKNGVRLTQAGKDLVINMDLVDEEGQVTQRGQEMKVRFEQDVKEFQSYE